MKTKIFLAIVSLSLMFCFCEDSIITKRDKMADELYNRITSVIYNNGSTNEWQCVIERIKGNKDTLFFIQNQDYTVLVTMRHNLMSDYITDTTKTLADTSKDSTSTGSWDGSSEPRKKW